MRKQHVSPSVWAPPQLSMRWWPVFLRNMLVWRKLALPSLVGNIAEPLMWLVAFGYGLGALVGEVSTGGQQVSYILFLASGSICMSAMNAASFEALYSAFSRMHMQKNLGRHHECASAFRRCGHGRNVVGGLQSTVYRHSHFGGHAGLGHQPQLEVVVGMARVVVGGRHLQLHCLDLQRDGQGL